MADTKKHIRVGSMLWAVTIAALGGTPVALGQSSSSAMMTQLRHEGSPAAVRYNLAEAQTAEQAPIQNAVDIVRDPADVAPPVGKRGPQLVRVSLTAKELEGKLDAVLGTTYEYWTFNGKVRPDDSRSARRHCRIDAEKRRPSRFPFHRPARRSRARRRDGSHRSKARRN